MGFEDEQDPVIAANQYTENQRKEAEQKQAETLAQMEKNKQEYEKKQQTIQIIATVVNELNKPFIDDLKDQREKIEYLANELQKTNEAVNKIITILNPAATTNPQQGQNMIQAVAALDHPVVGKFLDKIIDKVFGQEQQTAPLIGQDLINEKMTKAFMDDLETGESIRKFIADTLKKKATKVVVNEALGNMGKADVEHIPE